MKIESFRERRRLAYAVKEALDTLPSAVCYFTPSGSVKLCNSLMYELFRQMAQTDLQSLEELNQALADCDRRTGILREGNVFLFPDGRAWQYSSGQVVTEEGKKYTEVIFSNVTGLYEKRRELQRQSSELKKMYQELKELSDSVQEMTREQEILNMKSQLHDQMNLGVAAIRQILRQNTTSGENADAMKQFRRAIHILQAESVSPADDLSEFIRDAEVMGVQVQLCGELPKQEAVRKLLLPVMREACVNAARHADARQLFILAEQSETELILTITNDGKPPAGEVLPQGGLLDLEKLLARAGGRMQLLSRPAFVLTAVVPIPKEEEKQEVAK